MCHQTTMLGFEPGFPKRSDRRLLAWAERGRTAMTLAPAPIRTVSAAPNSRCGSRLSGQYSAADGTPLIDSVDSLAMTHRGEQAGRDPRSAGFRCWEDPCTSHPDLVAADIPRSGSDPVPPGCPRQAPLGALVELDEAARSYA
jgi:hypothetical protein